MFWVDSFQIVSPLEQNIDIDRHRRYSVPHLEASHRRRQTTRRSRQPRLWPRPTTPVVELLRFLHSDHCNAELFRNLTETDAGEQHMSAQQPTIIYTLTDEAPLLATYAFLPIVRTFAEPAGVKVTA